MFTKPATFGEEQLLLHLDNTSALISAAALIKLLELVCELMSDYRIFQTSCLLIGKLSLAEKLSPLRKITSHPGLFRQFSKIFFFLFLGYILSGPLTCFAFVVISL